jgi:hypothetical protein
MYIGGLFVSLDLEDTVGISKPYPPGARVEEFNPTLGSTHAGMVMDFPFDLSSLPQYLIMFDDGTTLSVSSHNIPALIPKQVTSILATSHLLPPFLKIGSKVTFEHNCQSIL